MFKHLLHKNFKLSSTLVKTANCCFGQKQWSKQLEEGGPWSFLISKPVLHVDPNGIQVQAAPPMETHHLAFCSGWSEEFTYFFTKWTILATTGVESQWLHDYMLLILSNWPVIARYASQHLIWILQLYLKSQ